MNWLLRGMKTNPQKPSGGILVKQRLRTEQQNVRSLFESTSFVIPSNRNTTYRSFNSDTLRNTSTQTSKTVVALDLNDSPRMSPDSLSPKSDFHNDPDYNKYFTDKPSIVNSGLTFSRKCCVLRYLHKPNNMKEDTRKDSLPENSLTKTFLGR